MNQGPAWSTARRILCVRLDNMGDVLMSTPAIRALRNTEPGRRITLLTSTGAGHLAPYLQDVDEVWTYDAAWVKNGAPGNACDRAVIPALRKANFDAAVIFTVYSQSALPAALMCHLAGIPRVLAHARENPYRLLSNWVREVEPSGLVRHEVQRQLDLVETVGAHCDDTHLSFATRESDRVRLRDIVRAQGCGAGRGAIVAHCGATAPSRRYRPILFARALTQLSDLGRPIFLTGDVAEQALTRHIASQCGPGTPVCELAGKLSLGELACLIEDADVLISNNTGPVHIAAAVQTPVVDLYALTNPQHTPWRVRHRLLNYDMPCRNCYQSVCPHGDNACLSNVDPARVADAVRELLQEGSGHTYRVSREHLTQEERAC